MHTKKGKMVISVEMDKGGTKVTDVKMKNMDDEMFNMVVETLVADPRFSRPTI